jgi:hypothetical protein
MLRRARGAPVSFEELRRGGIEFPASVVAELELMGVPIEHCQRSDAAGGRRLASVRLRPEDGTEARDPAVAPTPARGDPPTLAWTPMRVYRARPGAAVIGALASGRRLLALLALLAVVGAVAGVLAAELPGAARHRQAGRVRREHRAHGERPRSAAAAPGSLAARPAGASTAPSPPLRSTARPPTQPPFTPVSPTLASQLEAQGHELLLAGRYGDAVPVLRRALAATGEQLEACLEPTTDACLIFAYALYDLGRALRLSGDPAAAVPILEQRLEIDNQRPVVSAELALARQQAG